MYYKKFKDSKEKVMICRYDMMWMELKIFDEHGEILYSFSVVVKPFKDYHTNKITKTLRLGNLGTGNGQILLLMQIQKFNVKSFQGAYNV